MLIGVLLLVSLSGSDKYMAKLGKHKGVQKLDAVKYSVRSAQAILQYGVGAMVDFPEQTLMTAAPEYWEAKVNHIHDERLEKKLNVDYFGMPGGHSKWEWGIAYARFPEWYFCPKCRVFKNINSWVNEYLKKATMQQKENDPHMKRPRCMECKQDLVPSRIVVACRHGHIDDFPWELWAHGKKEVNICKNPSLTFETGATSSAGLEGLNVRCRNCNSFATLQGAFDKGALEKIGYECTGRMPWKNHSVDCDKPLKAMQRGASALYYPKVMSSLVIPPYSEKINEQIANSYGFNNVLKIVSDYETDERTDRINKRIDKWSEEISTELSVDTIVVRNILSRRLLHQIEDERSIESELKYRVEEFEALSGLISIKNLNESDFVREETDISMYNIPYIKGISLINKIREVRALTGFTRLEPPDPHASEDCIQGFVSSKEPETRWYPGYEVRGEGIFIQFSDIDIKRWSQENQEQLKLRAQMINSNYQSSYQGNITNRFISSKFILLHTIAHLLIRQLSFECGYTAASLRERLYCSDIEDGFEMSAILIYTASGDSEGTLGGLVRQGCWDTLPSIFRKAIEFGDLCSNDPVCISSKGQGRDALNLAACHSCTLLPETSCEEFNVFLDRGLVVGTFEDKSMGFYSGWLNN